MTLTAAERQARRFIEAVSALHEAGYGRLRLLCYIKEGLGAWRHRLFAADEFEIMGSTSTPLASLPGWPLVRGESIQEIMDNLQTQYPALLEQARGEIGEYAVWLKQILASYPEGILEMETPYEARLLEGGPLPAPFHRD